MKRLLAALTVGALGLATPLAAHADPQSIKIATLAPEGSSWMKLLHEWATNIEQKTNNQVKVKFYAGGVAGDERDAVRKMGIGQINGAAVTAVGLGLILPTVRALELPFMFKSYDELDATRNALDKDIRKMFEDKGYELLGWSDVGPVHLFTQTPIKTAADARAQKWWAWVDDPVVRTLFDKLGLNGVALGVPSVLPALQTGQINAFYGSPLASLALQWHSKAKYISSMVISHSIGAIVLKKKAWDALGPENQKIVTAESAGLTGKLLEQVRTDNKNALKKMQEQGLQVVETPPELIKEFQAKGKEVRAALDGQLYSKEFRERVEQLAAKGGK